MERNKMIDNLQREDILQAEIDKLEKIVKLERKMANEFGVEREIMRTCDSSGYHIGIILLRVHKVFYHPHSIPYCPLNAMI